MRLSDEIGVSETCASARLILARLHLYARDFASAMRAATAAQAFGWKPEAADVSLTLGIALLGEDDRPSAYRAFRDARDLADAALAGRTSYAPLDTKALSLCGAEVVEDTGRLCEAAKAFTAARQITKAEGIVWRVLSLFDLIAAADTSGLLAPVRSMAAGGKSHSSM